MNQLFNPHGINTKIKSMYEKTTKNGFAQFSFHLEYQPAENVKPVDFWANDVVKPTSGIANFYRKVQKINQPTVKTILKQSPKNPKWIDLITMFYDLEEPVTTETVPNESTEINIWKWSLC